MKPYKNKILIVDLSTKEIEERVIDDETLKLFPGGMALGARLLYELMPVNTDVFAPESVIGFVCGALNASGAFMSCRYTVVSKSPVTNGFNDASSGGTFGPDLRKAGFDGVFVKGISNEPVYILIDDGKVEIKDATKYWGTTTTTSLEKALKEELGKNITAASIGMAGEKLSYMAAIMNNGHRAAGRGGSGAVMGSKKLKAVVVTGGKMPEVENKEEVININKEVIEWHNGPVKEVADAFKAHGTGASYPDSANNGDLGIKNWFGAASDLTKEDINNIWAVEMDKKYKQKKFACFACPIGCGAIYKVNDEEMGRPEYETVGAFGSNLLNGDCVSVNICNHFCNEYGVDTISAGNTIGWAMSCYEAGLLSKDDLDGLELTWGNSEAINKLTEKMCKMEGVGAILGNGSVYASKHFGVGEEFRNDAGGIELPYHDARFAPPLARTYKFDPTPGRHVKGGVGPLSGGREPEYKNNPDVFAKDDIDGTKLYEAKVSLGCCQFTDFGYLPDADLRYYNAACGLNVSMEEYINIGFRSFMIRHLFNIRDGWTRKDTHIASRMVGNPPLEYGPLKGITVDVEKMGDNFYKGMGCDENGIPLKETLEKIGGLEFVTL